MHTRGMRFTTTLDSAGKTAAGFRVPREVVEALGKGKRPPVIVTINGYSYRNTVAVYGDEYLIGVAAEHRGPAGVTPGDLMEVHLELDTAPREVEVPSDFAEALDAAPDAKSAFESLSYSNKRRFTLSIEDAKTAETRQRRIEKSVAQLREGRT
jgi:Bacteriocin-protection, YdeI or OmpD-Associated/Domain of unknown function (DUF1905)